MSYNLFNLFEFCCNALDRKKTIIRSNYNGRKYQTVLEYSKSYFLFNLIDAELKRKTPA